MSTRRRRPLLEVALILTLLQIVAVVALEFGVRPGIEPVALVDRHAWLALFPARWILTLGLWMLVALALLGFFVVVMWNQESARFTRVAAWIVALATPIGLGALVALAGGLPLVATLEGTRTLAGVEQIVWGVALVPTHLLQAAAVLVLTRGLVASMVESKTGWRRSLVSLALFYLLAASGVAAAGFLKRPSLALLFIPIEASLLGAWSLLVATGLEKKSAAA